MIDKMTAEFINPFSGLAPLKKMTERELTRALRMALAAELEAVHLYESHVDATDNRLVKEVLQDIANEERVHVGELQRLLKILLPDEEKYMQEGASEVDKLVDTKAPKKAFATETIKNCAGRVASRYLKK